MERTLAGSSRPRTAAPRSGRGGSLPGTARERLLAAPRGAGRVLALAWRARRTRRVLICLLCAPPLLGGGWLLLRHSRLVAVEHVRILGAHGPQAGAIDAALRSTARTMSTLDVNAGALMAAVHAFPVVRAVHATPSFPHSLRLVVVEQPAVAALLVHGVRTAVAADGTALGPALLAPSLPTLGGWSEPPPGARLHDRSLLDALTVLGAAPARIARFVMSAYDSPQRGLTLAMTDGLIVYFGDASRPHAKWDSLVRVLADSSSTGASYVDVRVPEHPAAGGFPGGVPPDAPTGEAAGATSSQSAISALAATLSAGTGEELVGAKATEEAKAATSEGAEGEASSSSGESTETTPTEGEPKH